MFDYYDLIPLKDADFYKHQKIAGQTVAKCLKAAEKISQPGINLLEIESQLADIIEDNKCQPTFWKYKGFPGKICLSVNKELVHGIPRDYILKSGDVLKVDLGATFEGAIADAARTFIIGETQNKKIIQMVELCKNSLTQAVAGIRLGGQVGGIGYIISRYVRDNSNFGLITNYGGHGIDLNKPHADPFVSNKSEKKSGPHFQVGMTLAIEPMLTLHDTRTRIGPDKWTVFTSDIGAHFEDTVFINESNVEILTRTD